MVFLLLNRKKAAKLTVRCYTLLQWRWWALISPESFWCEDLVPFHSHHESPGRSHQGRYGLEQLPGGNNYTVWKITRPNVAESLAEVARWTVLLDWAHLSLFILEKKAFTGSDKQPLSINPRLESHQCQCMNGGSSPLLPVSGLLGPCVIALRPLQSPTLYDSLLFFSPKQGN